MDFTVKGVNYKASKLPAIKQFHIVRRFAPLLAGMDKGNPLESIMEGIGSLKDEDANYILFGLLACVEREQIGHGWAKIISGESIMFQDIDDIGIMFQIATKAFQENFTSFLDVLPSALSVEK